jgi:acyl-coenzyme A thioesterase PaaI-like protein
LIPSDPDFAARVRSSFERQGFMASLGAELTVAEPGSCEIRLPYRAGLSQQHGYFHAGA